MAATKEDGRAAPPPTASLQEFAEGSRASEAAGILTEGSATRRRNFPGTCDQGLGLCVSRQPPEMDTHYDSGMCVCLAVFRQFYANFRRPVSHLGHSLAEGCFVYVCVSCVVR